MDINKLRQLNRELGYNDKAFDNCDISTLRDGFARAVLAPSKYGELVYQMDDFEFSLWLKEHGLHSNEQLIQFAIDNTEFTIKGLFGL